MMTFVTAAYLLGDGGPFARVFLANLGLAPALKRTLAPENGARARTRESPGASDIQYDLARPGWPHCVVSPRNLWRMY